MSDSNNTKQSSNKPVFRKKLPGGISAAVFENTRDGRTYRSVNVQRSYLKDGKWHRMGIYLDHDQIPFMIEVLQGTWRYLNDVPSSGDAEHIDETNDPVETAAEPASAEA